MPDGVRRALGACLLAALACLALPAPAGANHPQAAHGDAIVFDHRTGNEWWVEVTLSGGASGSVVSVAAQDTHGGWTALTKRSWGAWAGSFHIEPGHQVRFLASWTGGATVDSCWFDHPSGVERCARGFEPSFTNVKGNEWWVETKVLSDRPLAGVDARMDCAGAWRPLTLRSWGAWAASFHVEPGSWVDFRARAADGSVAQSTSSYQWPEAKVLSSCSAPSPPSPFRASYTNVKGNEWWVEARVSANEPLAGVDARLACSEHGWIPLTLRSWGSWAGSFRVPAGTHVDFRARSTTGASDLSDQAYVWPQATPTDPCDAPWPRNGSHAQVRFRTEDTWSDVDGTHLHRTDGLVMTRFDGTGWDGTCEQRVTTRDGARWANRTETYAWDLPPPRGELPTTVGSNADAQAVEGCALSDFLQLMVMQRERRAFSIRTTSGDPAAIDAYHGHDAGSHYVHDFWWDATHGLVLSWDIELSGGNTRHAEGWLLDTDARFP